MSRVLLVPRHIVQLMAGLDAIKGVLLDVGDTLTTPRGGRWNPRFDFEDTLRAFGLDYGTRDDLAGAIAEGDAYLHRMAAEGNRADYHRVLLGALGLEPDDALLAALDAPLPFSRIIEVFPDVTPALTTLKERGFVLGIVSDTGAEARRLYDELGWTRFFDAYAISAELGCCKPDPRMYRTASEALGLEPYECLFVDNDRECVLGAMRLGYRACAISRYREPPSDDLTWVSDLNGVLALLPDRVSSEPASAG